MLIPDSTYCATFVLQICAFGCYLRNKPLPNCVMGMAELSATWLVNYALRLYGIFMLMQ